MAISISTDETVALTCPHCDEPLHRLVAVPVYARLGKRYAYGCPTCHRLLSISHRKGFFMG